MFITLFLLASIAGSPTVEFKPVHTSLIFNEPIQVIVEESDPSTMYVVEKDGLVRSANFDVTTKEKSIFLDITDRVKITNDEEGLLSFVFDPNYRENGWMYVWYSAQNPKRGVLSRFTKDKDEDVVDNTTEQVLLEVSEPWGNHNGGTVLFGKDGLLYLGIGDGGAANDPHGNSQNTNTLLGTVIRLDVSSPGTYTIPKSNPLVDKENARGEIWAWGLRNPWRMAFDRQGGELWIGDVGQNAWEEVDVATGGENFGWNHREGKHPFGKQAETEENFAPPIHEYGRRSGGSITGGYVYRGEKIATLTGAYIFSDYISKKIWVLMPQGEDGKRSAKRIANQTPLSIASFGETQTGEILACGFPNPYARKGKIYLLVGSEPASSTIP